MVTTCQVRTVASLIGFAVFLSADNAAAWQDSGLPMVIPQPQHLKALDAGYLVLGEKGVLLSKTLAAEQMVDLFRLERERGPILPTVAWIYHQRKNAAYDWRAQADRNQLARKLVDQALAACNEPAKEDLLRLSRCLEVASRICLLYDAAYRQKLDKTQIIQRADTLLSWMDTNFPFQITEPDGGDPATWKPVVTYIRH